MDGAVTAMRAKTRGTLAFSRRSSEAIHVASATHLTHSLSELDLSPMIPNSTQELLEWINEGRPPTPEKQQVDDEEVAKKKAFLAGRQRRSHQLLGSTSLPELPALHVRMPTRPTTADLQERQRRQLAAANPSPEDKRSRKKGRSPGRASVAAAAASAERKGEGAVGYTPPQPPTLRSQRSQRLAKMAVVDSVGLDSTSTWRFAGQLNTMGDMGNIARRALARRRQLRNALKKQLADERVPTPQFAARRELPSSGALPEPPSEEEGDSLLSALKYYAPSSASAKCPAYMFHEPGPEVRESLAILEEMRWPGGRRRLEVRHAQEVGNATRRFEVEREKEIADKAASTVQTAFRNKSTGPESPP